MKKKLFLLTTEFPYGDGEKSFIIPELEYLIKEFDITIISSASSDARYDLSKTTALDKNINVLWYPNDKMGNMEKIRYSMQALLSPAFLYDAGSIIREHKRIIQRISYSMQFYAYSLRMHSWIKKKFTQEMAKGAIIYSFWLYIPVMAAAMLKNEYGNFKLVSRAHGFDLYNERVPGGRQPFRSFIDKQLDKILFIAETGYKYYLNNIVHIETNHMTDVTEKYIVCHMGVKPSKLSERSCDGIFRIVSCSSVIPLKRIYLIIDALSEISNIKIYWTHFGDGSCMNEMKRYANNKISAKENIEYKFVGNVLNGAVRSYYGNNPVDLFITASETEGCPVSIQEAMASGIPVIGTAVGEIPLMIQGNGYVISKNPSSKEMAEKIEKLANQSANEILVMRDASYKLWDEKYNSDKNYSQLLNELMEL